MADDNGITCARLQELLASAQVFLIDARPYSDFVVGHIQGAVSTRLSSILIRRLGKNTIGVADLLVEEQKECYEEHRSAENHHVVVYDQSSGAAELAKADAKNPLNVLLKAVKRECARGYFLDGGISAMQEAHSELVEASTDVLPSPFLVCAPAGLVLDPPNPATPRLDTPIHNRVRDLEPSEILPFLLVGAKTHAENEDLLKSLNITAILNMTPSCPNHFEGKFAYKNIPIRDSWNQNLASFFDAAFSFIDECSKTGGRILIHCVAGISRSPAITIAYLMNKEKWSLAEAYALVKSKRPSISPNLDFMGELQMYEKDVLKLTSPLTLELPLLDSIDGEEDTPMDDNANDRFPLDDEQKPMSPGF